MKTIHEYMKLLSLELIPGRQIAAIQAILKQAMTYTVDRCVEVVDSSAGEYSQIGSAVMLVKTEIK